MRFMRVCLAVSWLLVVITAATVAGAVQAEDWRCVEVNGDQVLNVRSGPGVNYGLVAELFAGDQLEADYNRLTAADGYNWLPVRVNGDEGWVITVRLDACANLPMPTATPLVTGSGTVEDVDQDGTLDRYEIEQIAHSVVLLANIRNNRVRSTGTGTIITPDGLILTNAHVVDNGQTLLVGVLEDLNDPPEFQFVGEVVSLNESIDVALVAIRYDVEGRSINTANLDLPYIPTTLHPEDVYRGDAIYIFGYPGIGDDYLVVTTGSIVSVENGDVDGQRLPVWYRTDAEIAPGNSGGLAVNGNGEFVGIPTFVQTEGQTGGRLGGVRPTDVALMAVEAEDASVSTPNAAMLDPEPPAGDLVDLAVTVQSVEVQHDTVENDQPGMMFTLAFTIFGWERQNARVVGRVFHDDLASAPVINPTAPPPYRDDDFAVLTVEPIQPCCPQTIYTDFALFLPYEVLGFTQPGSYPLKIQLEIAASDGSWHTPISWEFVTYTLE